MYKDMVQYSPQRIAGQNQLVEQARALNISSGSTQIFSLDAVETCMYRGGSRISGKGTF